MNSFDSLVSFNYPANMLYTYNYPISDVEIHVVATDNNNISIYVCICSH